MEKKYIEHEKVIEVIKNFAKRAISDGQKALDPVDDIVMLLRAVDMIPAADVEEVVRCEKCEHWDEGYRFCKIHGLDCFGNSAFSEQGFCSLVEKKGAE